MANSLLALFQAISSARDDRELRMRVMDAVGEHFGALRWGIYLLNEKFQLAEVDVCGVSDVNAFVECCEKFGLRRTLSSKLSNGCSES
jgi:hypothetical protein